MFARRVLILGRGAVAAALLLGLGSCLSPTLPVPPPEPLALQEPLARLIENKRVQVDGMGASKQAMVAFWNRELGAGIIVQADEQGAYHALLDVDVSCVRPHNHIQMWQTDMEGDTSEVKTYSLPNVLDVPLPPPADAGCPDAGTVPADVDPSLDGAPGDALDAGAD